MILTDRSTILLPAEKVWPFLVTPAHFVTWSHNLVSVDAREPFTLGRPFSAVFKWNDKPIQFLVTPTIVEPNRRLELRFDNAVGEDVRPDLRMVESIELQELFGRTVVTKRLALTHHGIAWYWVVVMTLITALGHRVGPDRLKDLCEGRPVS